MLPSEAVVAAIVTTGVGVVMLRLGLHRGVFEARVDSRRCVTCGRIMKAKLCRHCSHR